MATVTVKFKDGGSRVLTNPVIKYLFDETHYFMCDMDRAINTVYVVNEEGFFVREYATQSFNAC